MNSENPLYLPLTALVESLIFAAPEPVSPDVMVEIIGGSVKPEDVLSAINTLNEEYDSAGRSFRIIQGGGGWRFATREEYGRWVKKLVVGSGRLRLSRAALETLSLIAYRQPISRAGIEKVRGVDVGGVLKTLVERRMVKATDRGVGPGKPMLYANTGEFLKYFGLNSLTELPPVESFIRHGGTTGELFQE